MSKEKAKFNSFLADEFEAYLRYRIQVGFTCNRLRWAFAIFDRYVIEQRASFEDLTPAFFLKFRHHIRMPNGTINKIFIHLRSLFEYLVRVEKIKENPLRDISKLPEPAYIPFLFSPQQTESLLESIRQNIRRDYDS